MMRGSRIVVRIALVALAGVAVLVPAGTPTASADHSTTPGGQMVSEVAAAGTPHVLNGRV